MLNLKQPTENESNSVYKPHFKRLRKKTKNFYFFLFRRLSNNQICLQNTGNGRVVFVGTVYPLQ